MKKTRSRFLSLLLAVILIASVVPVQAVSPNIAPYRFDNVASCSIALSITNKGLATCTSNIVLRSGVTAEMTVTLYKSTDKKSWDYVKSWDTSGSLALALEKSYYVMSGHYYKAVLSADIYNSSGSLVESITSTSNIRYY